MRKRILTTVSSLAILASLFLFFGSLAYAKTEQTSPPHSSQNSSTAKKKLARLNLQIKNLKKEIDAQKQQEALIRTQLRQTETKLNQTSQTLQILSQNIEGKKKSLACLREDVEALNQKQKQYQDILARTIRLKFENHLQKNKPLNQNSHQLYFYHYYAKAQEKHIKKLIHDLSQYRLVQQTAEQEKIALESLESELSNEKNRLQLQQSHVQKTIPNIAKIQQKKSAQLSEMLEQQKQIELLIKKLSKKTVFWVPPSPTGAPINLHNFAKAAGKLALPIHQKNARLVKNKQSKFIIPALEGTPVYAVYPGRVIFAEWLRGFGLLMILDHGAGYMSLYGHNELLYKKTGDWVNIHEQIARVGNSGKNDIQSDSGLYFEIRKNGQALNLSKWIQRV